MNIRRYIGHKSQFTGVEEHRYVGGYGDGMRLLLVRNGQGLDFTISLDRCADISRLSFRGYNFGYFGANGYVSPSYYDRYGDGFFKGFYAGFLTTCGLQTIGNESEDNGKHLPLHGTISNTPAEKFTWNEDDKRIVISATIVDACLFDEKLELNRTIICMKDSNVIRIEDAVTNFGNKPSTLMILYHTNIGYPLLCEHTQLRSSAESICANDAAAKADKCAWNDISSPASEYLQRSFLHTFHEEAKFGVFNPKISRGLIVQTDDKKLNRFLEWKMLEEIDYVLGIEPLNCLPKNRTEMRTSGSLPTILPNEVKTFSIEYYFYDQITKWEKAFQAN